MSRIRLWGVLAIVISLVPAGVLAWSLRDIPHFGRLHDDGLYVVLAKTLAGTGEYRIASLPGRPHETKYPPGFPAWLSLAWRLNPDFPGNLPLIVLFCWTALPVLLMLVWLFGQATGVPRSAVLAACMALPLTHDVALYAISPMSELAFTAVLLGCLLLVERAARPDGRAASSAAAGIGGGLAYLVRTAGLPLLAAVPVYLLARRAWGRAAAFAASMLPPVAWWLWWVSARRTDIPDPAIRYYTDYAGHHLANWSLLQAPALMSANLSGLLQGIGKILVPWAEGRTSTALGALALAAIPAALVWWRVTAYHVYSVLYLGAIVVWPLQPGDHFGRLALPVLPLIALSVAQIARSGFSAARRWWAQGDTMRLALAAAVSGALLLPGAAFLAGTAGWIATSRAFAAGHRSTRAANRQAMDWIRSRLPEDATFVTEGDAVLYLYTGRRAYAVRVRPGMGAPSNGADPAEFIAALRESVAITRPSHAFQPDTGGGSPDLFARTEGFRLLMQQGAARVYATR